VEDFTGTGNNILTVCTQKGQVCCFTGIGAVIAAFGNPVAEIVKIPPVINKATATKTAKVPKDALKQALAFPMKTES